MWLGDFHIFEEREQNLNILLEGEYDAETNLVRFKTERLFETGDSIDHVIGFES